MIGHKQQIADLHTKLGLKQLNRMWAKIEIFLGLAAAGGGLLLGFWSVVQTEVHLLLTVAALLLFVLGGYLAMAGHRSHLYQSSNELTAWLLEEIRQTQERGTSHA